MQITTAHALGHVLPQHSKLRSATAAGDPQDTTKMLFDRVNDDMKLFGDLMITQTLSDKLGNFGLTGRNSGHGGRSYG